MLTNLLCIFLIWPALMLRWGLPAARKLRPAPRTIKRQWGLIGTIGRRAVVVRLQVAIV